MFAASLTLALALGPEPAIEPAPASDELPHWRSVPPRPAPQWQPQPQPKPKPKPLVPNDGAGMIALGSMLLGTSAGLGFTALGLSLTDRPRQPSDIGLGVYFVGPTVVAGTVLLSLGLVTRRQFRRSDANIPDAPPIGSGMLMSGFGLMAAGTVFAIQGAADMTSLICDGGDCSPPRPIGAPIQLGCSLVGLAAGVALTVGGVKRRLAYRDWAQRRVQLQPSLGVSPTALSIGLVGRF